MGGAPDECNQVKADLEFHDPDGRHSSFEEVPSHTNQMGEGRRYPQRNDKPNVPAAEPNHVMPSLGTDDQHRLSQNDIPD